MSTEQHRKMLEAAAKACGPEYQYDELEHCWYKETDDDYFGNPEWNPLTNPADTAEMCAKLLIDTCFYLQLGRVTCDFYYGTDNIRDRVRVEFKDHDNSRLKAWMFAATMVSAKIGGYEDEF